MLNLLFVLIFNLWIWKLFQLNPFIGLLTVITTTTFWLVAKNKGKWLYFWIFFLALNYYQWQTTTPKDLVNLTDDELTTQVMRSHAHPSIYMDIFGKRVWIPTANWMELRKESTVYYRIKENFAEILDPNLYFFASHPRERVGITEFEKIPYILLPFLLMGFVSLPTTSFKIYLPILLPLLLISVRGNVNPLGPFVLFPFLAVTTTLGLDRALAKTKKLSNLQKYILIFLFLMLFLLVFIQVISYAKN